MADIAAVFLRNHRGELLMQERDEHAPTSADLWGIPGGGIEPGENPIEAAYREMLEETGLALPPGTLRPWRSEPFRNPGSGQVNHYHLYSAIVAADNDDITCGEGRQMVFVPWPEVTQRDLSPSTAHFFPEFAAEQAARAARFACVIVTDPEGRILMQERDEHARIDPDRWGLVGGHLEPGESPLAAAYRELEEETGVRLREGLEFRTEAHVFHAVNDTVDSVSVFSVTTELPASAFECREGRQITFVAPERVPELSLTTTAGILLSDIVGTSPGQSEELSSPS